MIQQPTASACSARSALASRTLLPAALLALAALVASASLPLHAQDAPRRTRATANGATTNPAAGATANTNGAPAADNAAAPQAATAAATAGIAADDEVAQALLANSPFMSKAFKERLAKSDTNRARDLVFRGFAGNNGSWLINVYNNKSKVSQWVKVGDQVDGVTIAEFDPQKIELKIVKDASTVILKLEKTR